ncbi:hypothetical protein EYF80_028665 [Liparis tanakae]|uniref:Uncharacterized protein n=1 Tax=Liparis tanakae TaxID=230148 RepID=A0A4Z2H5K5_9TELE|nr:hypothetical protein EYF80_028665 [Liparis tanakae]
MDGAGLKFRIHNLTVLAVMFPVDLTGGGEALALGRGRRRTGVAAHEGRGVAGQGGVQKPGQRVGHLDASTEQLWSHKDRRRLLRKQPGVKGQASGHSDVVVRVGEDLQGFGVEQHLHCDEVGENPLQETDKAAVVVSGTFYVCEEFVKSKRETDFDVLQFLPLEVSHGLLQLSDAALGVAGSLLSVYFCLDVNTAQNTELHTVTPASRIWSDHSGLQSLDLQRQGAHKGIETADVHRYRADLELGVLPAGEVEELSHQQVRLVSELGRLPGVGGQQGADLPQMSKVELVLFFQAF